MVALVVQQLRSMNETNEAVCSETELAYRNVQAVRERLLLVLNAIELPPAVKALVEEERAAAAAFRAVRLIELATREVSH